MDVVKFLLDAFKIICAFAVLVGFSMGVSVLGYRLTGQSKAIVFAEDANHKKAGRVGLTVFLVSFVGVVLWVLTGTPFA